MAELQREGKVRYIGLSNFPPEEMERCLEIARITSLQPPYSMINRSAEAGNSALLCGTLDRGH